MSKVVNLNQFRKRRRKEERETTASENRVTFGQTKKQREWLRLSSERSRAELDNKLLEDKSAPKDPPEKD